MCPDTAKEGWLDTDRKKPKCGASGKKLLFSDVHSDFFEMEPETIALINGYGQGSAIRDWWEQGGKQPSECTFFCILDFETI